MSPKDREPPSSSDRLAAVLTAFYVQLPELVRALGGWDVSHPPAAAQLVYEGETFRVARDASVSLTVPG